MTRARWIKWLRAPVCSAAIAFFSVTHAIAQQAPPSGARALFERGLHALESNRYAEAALALEASCRIRRVPVALYNLGLAYRGVGRYREAITAFEGYLHDSASSPDEAQREAVRHEIDELQASLAVLNLTLDPPDAVVRLDGRLVTPVGGELETDPGDHVIEVSAEHHRAARQELLLEPGAAIRRHVVLTADEAVDDRAAPGSPPDTRPSLFGPGAWVGGGIVVVASATALGLWIDGSLQAATYADRCRTYPPALTCASEQRTTQARLNDLAAPMDVAWGIALLGGVVLAVDVLTGLLSHDHDAASARHPTLAFGASREGVALRW